MVFTKTGRAVALGMSVEERRPLGLFIPGSVRGGYERQFQNRRMTMEHNGFYFADRTGAAEPTKPDLLPAVTIPKEAIEAEVERLASLPAPANGRRASIIANPLTGPGRRSFSRY